MEAPVTSRTWTAATLVALGASLFITLSTASNSREITALCLLSCVAAFTVLLLQHRYRRALLARTLCDQQRQQLQLALTCRTTSDGVVLNASSSFQELFPAGVPARIQDCFESPDVWPEIVQKVAAQDYLDCELSLRYGDVSVPARQRFWAIRDANGHIVEIEANILDLTAQKRLQDMLDKAGRELEQKNEEIQEHAAVMSRLRRQLEGDHRHNLEFLGAVGRQTRRPLVSLLQLAGATRGHSAATVTEASASARDILAWLDTIVEFATLETTRATPAREPFSLRQILDQVIDKVALAAERKPMDLGVIISHETPDLVLGDGPRLEQLLAALFEIAVACRDAGAVRLRVGLIAPEGPERRITFHLDMSGPGLPPAVLESPGNPLAGNQDRKISAIRLRLAIAQRIAEQSNANLTVHNQPGNGTQIEFSMPIVVQQNDAVARLDITPLQGISILVVEPAAASREAVTETLRGWGMTVATATSSEAALEQLRLARSEGRHFRIALIDFATPPGGGLPLVETVLDDATLPRVCPILVLPHSHRLWQNEPLLPGLPASLSKPLRDRELAAALLECLREEPQPAPTPRSRRVLVAEDDAVNRRIALRLIQRMGYEADGVTNGEEAVEALRLRPYGIVFMDCMMPVMDGFRATALIRALPGSARNVPIIALTAKALAGDRRRCLDAGMNDYLSKPFTYEDLRASIERWIDTPVPAGSLSG
ncbi:MAG: response regulator [Bryobacterales bacterium]|nr:response regulator [Bryobacterales bacterium]